MPAPTPDVPVRQSRPSRRAAPAASPRRHPLAIPGLVFALIPCCPPAGLLGAMLGIFAMRGVRLRPDLYTGRQIAIAAILIGCIHAIVTAGLLQSFAQRQQESQRRLAREMVRLVIAGDPSPGSDPASLFTSSAAITDHELQAFRAFLRERYGAFDFFTPAVVTPRGEMLRPQLDVAGSFTFDGRPVLGSVRFDVAVQPPSMQTRLRVQWMRVGDEEGGRLGPVQ